MQQACCDGVAAWYDAELATSELGLSGRGIVQRLLGPGPGRLLDVGCGGGSHMLAFAEDGWSPVGVDISADQLALARERDCDVLQSRAEELPFEDDSFDGAVSMWTHTDVDDFAAMLGEIARVVRPGGRFVYLGIHPCFVGPHSQFVRDEGVPLLHPGYRTMKHYTEAPGISPDGLRARVGATHLPLGVSCRRSSMRASPSSASKSRDSATILSPSRSAHCADPLGHDPGSDPETRPNGTLRLVNAHGLPHSPVRRTSLSAMARGQTPGPVRSGRDEAQRQW